jgi:hypothetical protein
MRRYGLYDATRGLMTALAAGVAGLLVWLATQVGQQSTGRFWEAMGLVAAAGLVLVLLPALGHGMKGLRLRLSPGTFLLGFIPTLVAAGWILVATQPGHGWHDGTLTSWSKSIGIMGLVHALGLYHGVLAFGIGAMLGMSLDAIPVAEPVVEPVERPVERQVTRTVPADETAPVATTTATRGPRWRRRSAEPAAADEPLTAERESATSREPHMVTVGPATDTRTETDRVDETR